MRCLVVLFALSCAPMPAPHAVPAERGFLLRTFEWNGQRYPYSIYVPASFDGKTAIPAVLFLHGAGERGEEGLRSTAIGLGNAVRFDPARWPALVLFPQTPPGRQWAGDTEEMALALLDHVMESYAVDPDRVYLTGLSMGGAGAWSLASRHPERFAALVPVCGWIMPMAGRPEYQRDLRVSGWDPDAPWASAANRVKDLPIWIWHGALDASVPVEESRRMAAALRAAGADVRYTELPGVGHNAWDPAYGSAEMAAWMFEQRRR